MKTTTFSLVLTVLLTLGTVTDVLAQTWTTITSGWRPRDIIITAGKVWAPSEGGLLVVNSGTEQLRVLNVDHGLSSNFVVCAELDESTGFLWLGHNDGSVDVYDPSRETVVQAIRDFYNDPAVQTTHDIYASSDGVFVAHDQGLSRMQRVEGENLWVVQETYRGFGSWPRPSGISHVEVLNGSVIAGSELGIARADLDGNLLDVSQWSITPVNDLVPGQSEFAIRNLTQSDGTLLLSYGGTQLLVWQENGWITWNTEYGAYDAAVLADGTMYLAMADGLYRQLPTETAFSVLSPDYRPKFWGVAVADNGDVWGAIDTSPSYFGGIARWDGANMDVFFPNSPGGDQILNSGVSPGGDVWLAARSTRIAGAYQLRDGAWQPWARPNSPHAPWNTNTAINMIAFDDYEGTWIGTWGNSVYYIRPMEDGSDSLFYFHPGNSPLRGLEVDGSYTVVNGAAPSRTGGMWISSMLAYDDASLYFIPQEWFVFGPDGWDMDSWVAFGPEQGNTFSKLSQIQVDSRNRLWMTSLHQDPDQPIAVLDPGVDPIDPFDDSWYNETDFPVEVEFETVNALLMGDDDILWFGTRDGLFYADASQNIEDVVFTRVYGALGQSINALALDPLNQLWVGTDFGVSVLGRDRFSWIAQYTTADGPHPSGLVDNQVTSISVRPESGDVYIGTNAGVSVLSTPYREFGDDLGEIVVAPQPFRIGDGSESLRFGSTSLVADATVRLFTPSGRKIRTLSFQQASGAGWDGRDDSGEWVGSGVYYIVVTDPSGASQTGKVAVVRQ